MARTQVLLSSTLIAAVYASACGRAAESAKPPPVESAPANTSNSPEAPPNSLVSSKSPSAVWPDGWVLMSEQEWIPILDDTGRALERARAAFLQRDMRKAEAELKSAVDITRKEAARRSNEEKQRLEPAISQLQELSTQLEGPKPVTADEFDRALASAYRSAAVSSYLYLSQEQLLPMFEQPRVHYERALEMLAKHQNQAAADEIRRGAGYFRLASSSARSDDRSILDAQVQKLDQLATRAEQGKLDSSALKGVLSDVDAAYAASYLHQAEAAYKANERARESRALQEAIARMRARLGWLGTEGQQASSAVVKELESIASQAAKGITTEARKMDDLLGQARSVLAKGSSEHAPATRGSERSGG